MDGSQIKTAIRTKLNNEDKLLKKRLGINKQDHKNSFSFDPNSSFEHNSEQKIFEHNSEQKIFEHNSEQKIFEQNFEQNTEGQNTDND